MTLVSIVLAAALQVASASGNALAREIVFVPPMPGPAPVMEVVANTDCIALDRVRSTRIIRGTGIVYEMSRRTRFINRLRSGARHLSEGQVLLIRRHGPLLCAGDTVYLVDGLTGAAVSFVGLGVFERYDEPEPPVD